MLKFFSIFLFFMTLGILNGQNPTDSGDANCIIVTCAESHYVYFAIAKTGTRTTTVVLNKNTNVVDNHKRVRWSDDLREMYQQYMKFTFVRNPWDRVVSCYFNRVKRGDPNFKECHGKSFKSFVKFICEQDLTTADIHIRLQSSQFPLDDIHFIGKFENFEDDLRYILDLLGVEAEDIPKINASKHEHYSKYYDSDTEQMIREQYQKDIELFGYEFEREERSL